MDFDPGECYDDSEYPEEEDTIEYDDNGDPIYLAAAAGFGYHMAQDDLEERKLAKGILDRYDQKEATPIKVPLSQRHQKKGYMTPFARWAAKANRDPKAIKEDIEYTLEEKLQIIRAQHEE